MADYLSAGNLDIGVSLALLHKLKAFIHTAIEHSAGQAKKEAKELHQTLGDVITKLGSGQIKDEPRALWDCYAKTGAVIVLLQQSLENDEWK